MQVKYLICAAKAWLNMLRAPVITAFDALCSWCSVVENSVLDEMIETSYGDTDMDQKKRNWRRQPPKRKKQKLERK